MAPNVEDVSEVEIGKRYWVPTVVSTLNPKHLRVVPVVGPLHEDAEFISFPDRHWHPDRRFVSEAWLKDNERNHWAVVLTPYPTNRNLGPFGGVPSKDNEPLVTLGERRLLKCKRLIDSFGHLRDREVAIPWTAKLERAYRNERLRKMICPHRGISCVGVIAESDGGVVCPGHGLKWNRESGSLMSRCGQDFSQKSLFVSQSSSVAAKVD